MIIFLCAARRLAPLLLALAGLSAQAGTIHPFTLGKQSYAGSRERHYKVYVPDGLSGPAPLVMALHGCEQTNDTVLRDWGLVAAADRYKFILVAPFITSVAPQDGLRAKNCWGFWLDAHRRQGRGEAEDLHQIARQVETRFGVDPQRRYVTGLSSGGAMAVVLSVTHNEYFAAAASAAGLPYGEDSASVSLFGGCPGSARFHPVTKVVEDMRRERDHDRAMPLMVLQNNRDCTVIQPAGRHLRDAQLKLDGGAHDTPSKALAQQRTCSPVFGEAYGCQQIYYTADGQPGSRSLVETVFYEGPTATPDPSDKDHGHYWIGGEHGRDGPYGLRRGPSYPDIVWDFFARHAGGPPVNPPVITLLGDNPLALQQGDTFTDPGATAQDAEDGSLVVLADCASVNTGQAGTYQCSYRATDSAGHTSTATRSVVVGGGTTACIKQGGAPGMHVSAGRAVSGGLFGLRALASGDQQDIGFAYDYFFAHVTMYRGEGEFWFVRPPAGCPA